MNVLVVSNPELGWDCVIGVYADTPRNRELLQSKEENDGYVITERDLEQDYEDCTD